MQPQAKSMDHDAELTETRICHKIFDLLSSCAQTYTYTTISLNNAEISVVLKFDSK